MDAKAPKLSTARGGLAQGLKAPLSPEAAGRLAAAAGDVTMVVDRDGVIRDLALANEALERDGAAGWLDRRWRDVVTAESRPKVDALLRDAGKPEPPRWREINQVLEGAGQLMVRFTAVAGEDGEVIVVGRDERAASLMRLRLLEAQQAMERDYARLRDAEGRYRLLFRQSEEAVLVVDATTRRVTEANPAAERLLGGAKAELAGESFATLFDGDSRDDAAALLALAQAAGRTSPAQATLTGRDRRLAATASVFRQDRTTYALVRLAEAETPSAAAVGRGADLAAVLERIPDAFVLTDEAMTILAANTAFLDMAGLGATAHAVGRPLSDFLGRAGLERDLLLDALRQHGGVRGFRTLMRDGFGEGEDVEVSGAAAPERDGFVYGLTLRPVDRRLTERPHAAPELRRSVEQMTELVGRMTLKELVRETTDLVERLCIEAALELTRNNRASAAEVLGLSRQSLYSKLNRFGLAGGAADAE